MRRNFRRNIDYAVAGGHADLAGGWVRPGSLFCMASTEPCAFGLGRRSSDRNPCAYLYEVGGQQREAMSTIECLIRAILVEVLTCLVALGARTLLPREDFVPRASRPCPGTAGTAVARLWLRLRRAVYT
jgi:hypothetical protein